MVLSIHIGCMQGSKYIRRVSRLITAAKRDISRDMCLATFLREYFCRKIQRFSMPVLQLQLQLQ